MPKLFDNEQIVGGKLHFTENVNIKPVICENDKLKDIKSSLSEAVSEKKLILKPKIAAIHAGRTRNNTIYNEQYLRGNMAHPNGPSGMYSFLYPYNKPMLKNHDTWSEPTGRIMNAQYVATAGGGGFIQIVPHITDQDAIEKILDGRYLTVSIGATADSAICNICGKDIIKEGWCEHERGETYDGNVCGWLIGELWFDECSWVNIPSDSTAKILDTSEAEIYAEVNKESYDISTGVNITESVAEDLGLNAIINEEAHSEETTEDGSVETKTETPEAESTEEPKVIQTETTENVPEETTENNSETEKTDETTLPEGACPCGNEGNASNDNQELIQQLNNRIEELEREVEELNQQIAREREEYQKLSNELSDFVREAIKDNTKNFNLESITDESLSTLSIDELRLTYSSILTASIKKYSELESFKVKNPFFETTNAPEHNTETIEVIEGGEEKTPEKPANKDEIYKYLLGGKPKRK